MKNIRLLICLICLSMYACGIFSKQLNVQETKVTLLGVTDQKVVTFATDSIQMIFSYSEVVKLLQEDLKGNKRSVEEYDSKKILLDSLMGQAVKVNIEAFALEKARNYVQVAMLSVSNKLLRKGHAQITLNGQRLKQIKFELVKGPYNSQSVSYYYDNKLIFYYPLSLGE